MEREGREEKKEAKSSEIWREEENLFSVRKIIFKLCYIPRGLYTELKVLVSLKTAYKILSYFPQNLSPKWPQNCLLKNYSKSSHSY